MKLNRRDFLTSCGAFAATSALSAPVNSLLGAQGVRFKKSETPIPYISDGLIAMWDGEWNAGWDNHDPDSSVWTDLSGNGYDFDIPATGAFWDGNSLNLQNTSLSQSLPEVSREDFTIEAVYIPRAMSNGAIVWMDDISSGWAGSLLHWNSNGICYYPWKEIGRVGSVNAIVTTSVSWSPIGQRLMHNGRTTQTKTETIASQNVLSSIYLGEFFGNKVSDATYCSIRLYSRMLTLDESQYNYIVDTERFGL